MKREKRGEKSHAWQRIALDVYSSRKWKKREMEADKNIDINLFEYVI